MTTPAQQAAESIQKVHVPRYRKLALRHARFARNYKILSLHSSRAADVRSNNALMLGHFAQAMHWRYAAHKMNRNVKYGNSNYRRDNRYEKWWHLVQAHIPEDILDQDYCPPHLSEAYWQEQTKGEWDK